MLGGYGYINMINMDGDYIVYSEKDRIGRTLSNVFSEPYFDSDEAENARQELQENGELAFFFSYGKNRYEAIIPITAERCGKAAGNCTAKRCCGIMWKRI